MTTFVELILLQKFCYKSNSKANDLVLVQIFNFLFISATNDNNIPGVISTYDTELLKTPNRPIWWTEVNELPMEPGKVFENIKTMYEDLNVKESLQVEKACLLTQGHARSLEFIGEYLSLSNEVFSIANLYSFVEKKYKSYVTCYNSDILIKLFMLDITNANLRFGMYLCDPYTKEKVAICNFGLKWDELIREALVLNKMIVENHQFLKLNLLQLKFFFKDISSCFANPLLLILCSIPDLPEDRPDSFERYHISFEAFKFNVCIEYGNKISSGECVPLQCGKFKFEIVGEKLMLPLSQWLHTANCYENYKLILDGPKTSLKCLEYNAQKQIFSEIDTENYFLCPNNWNGFDSVLNLNILDKSGKYH